MDNGYLPVTVFWPHDGPETHADFVGNGLLMYEIPPSQNCWIHCKNPMEVTR